MKTEVIEIANRRIKKVKRNTSLRSKRAVPRKKFEDIAYDRGFDTGYDQGFLAGKNEALALIYEQEQIQAAERTLECEQSYGEGFNAGHDDGYCKGHDEGYRTGYDRGYDDAAIMAYEQGYYAGGNEWVDHLLPSDHILPHRSVQDVIEQGLQHYRSEMIPLMSAAEVASKIIEAMDQKSPLSVIRLGDGELLTLSQETVLPSEEVARRGHFLGYAGVELPDPYAREVLKEAIRQADIVGVPLKRMQNFQQLLVPALTASDIDYRAVRYTSSIVNYSLYYEGHLKPILSGRTVLIIGNQAEQLAQHMSACGVTVAEPIRQVHGIKDVSRVMDEVANRSFDIALVSAGVAAVPITQRIAKERGRTALDFGHMADIILNQAVCGNLRSDL